MTRPVDRLLGRVPEQQRDFSVRPFGTTQAEAQAIATAAAAAPAGTGTTSNMTTSSYQAVSRRAPDANLQ